MRSNNLTLNDFAKYFFGRRQDNRTTQQQKQQQQRQLRPGGRRNFQERLRDQNHVNLCTKCEGKNMTLSDY